MILTLLNPNILNTDVVGSENQSIYKVVTPWRGPGGLVTTVTRTDVKPERVVAIITWSGPQTPSSVVEFNGRTIPLSDFLVREKEGKELVSGSRCLQADTEMYKWKMGLTTASSLVKMFDSQGKVVANFRRPESLIFRKPTQGYLELSNTVAMGSLDAVFVSFLVLKQAQQRKKQFYAQSMDAGCCVA